MGFRKSPNLMASGAMGILTGLVLAGGFVFALSLPAQAAAPVAASQTLERGSLAFAAEADLAQIEQRCAPAGQNTRPDEEERG